MKKEIPSNNLLLAGGVIGGTGNGEKGVLISEATRRSSCEGRGDLNGYAFYGKQIVLISSSM
jgi:hypothetical protein